MPFRQRYVKTRRFGRLSVAYVPENMVRRKAFGARAATGARSFSVISCTIRAGGKLRLHLLYWWKRSAIDESAACKGGLVVGGRQGKNWLPLMH